MKLQDSFDLTASRQLVWDYFLDVEKLAECIPGVQSVEQIDDTRYRGTLVVQLGPVKQKFVGEVTLIDLVEPDKMVGAFNAKDQAGGSNVSAKFTFNLAQTSPDKTTTHYECDLAIRGRIAAFGGGVIAETAKQITSAFASCLQQELNTAQAESAGLPAPASPPETLDNSGRTRPPKASILAIIAKSLATVVAQRAQRLLRAASNLVRRVAAILLRRRDR